MPTRRAGQPAPAHMRWWQWLLIYPGLVLGLLGSVPTVVEAARSWQMKVPYGTTDRAREIDAMLTRNLACLERLAGDEEAVRLADDTLVHVVACTSGDILIRIDPPRGRSMLRWIARETLLPVAPREGASTLLPAAEAQTRGVPGAAPRATRVLCVFRDRDGAVVRRLQLETGGCIDEVIDRYTGVITSRRTAPCSC